MGFKSGTGCKNPNCKDVNCKDFLCGVVKEYPIFTQYISPKGGLDRHLESHALFYYYLLAQKAIEEEPTQIVYEGNPDKEYKHYEILKGVAQFYGVDLAAMTNAWKEVDMTCFMHSLPKLPDKYRYPNKITIITRH